MCGIIGSEKKEIWEAIRLLNHRGPDALNIYQDESLSIGHTLLSIRGTVKESVQPKFETDSPWVLAFNGQIYNTNEIKKNKISKINPYFKGDVDTNILFELIKQEGWKFIEYIQGMFVIVLYHKTEKKIRIYRDYSGQKPIYFSTQNNHFKFSSEIKAILKLSTAALQIEPDAVALSSMIGYLPGRKTIMKDIFKVLPGECVEYDLVEKQLKTYQFKLPSTGYLQIQSPSEVIKDTIGKHLLGQYQVAINLSGGLDSSVIYHEINQLDYNPISYSTFFDLSSTLNERYNEDAVLAKKLAATYNKEHREIFVTKQNYLDCFIGAYSTIEDPNYNMNLPVYYFTALKEGKSGDNQRIVLSGDSGDEVFGGYPHYSKNQLYDRVNVPLLRNLVKVWKNRNQRLSLNYFKTFDLWFSLRGWNPRFVKLSEQKQNLYLYFLNSAFQDYIKEFNAQSCSIWRMMMLERFLWLSNENFIRSDKLYMSQSIEIRNPFGYTPLQNYFDKRISSKQYINSKQNKLFLRDLYKNTLPPFILNKKNKTGWTAPIRDEWYDHKTKDLFISIVDKFTNKDSDLINWKSVRISISKTNIHPGKDIHLYLSLAILANKYGVDI